MSWAWLAERHMKTGWAAEAFGVGVQGTDSMLISYLAAAVCVMMYFLPTGDPELPHHLLPLAPGLWGYRAGTICSLWHHRCPSDGRAGARSHHAWQAPDVELKKLRAEVMLQDGAS